MMSRAGILLLLSAILTPLPAHAAGVIPYARFRPASEVLSRTMSKAYSQCNDRSGGVTVELRDCSAAEHARKDVRLNQVYGATMARLNAAQKLQLRQSQRAWLKTRWKACEVELEDEGTLALIAYDGCTLDEVARRILWLERYER
jgi:uncharacterized protein YecT (DUF1311 family)